MCCRRGAGSTQQVQTAPAATRSYDPTNACCHAYLEPCKKTKVYKFVMHSKVRALASIALSMLDLVLDFYACVVWLTGPDSLSWGIMSLFFLVVSFIISWMYAGAKPQLPTSRNAKRAFKLLCAVGLADVAAAMTVLQATNREVRSAKIGLDSVLGMQKFVEAFPQFVLQTYVYGIRAFVYNTNPSLREVVTIFVSLLSLCKAATYGRKEMWFKSDWKMWLQASAEATFNCCALALLFLRLRAYVVFVVLPLKLAYLYRQIRQDDIAQAAQSQPRPHEQDDDQLLAQVQPVDQLNFTVNTRTGSSMGENALQQEARNPSAVRVSNTIQPQRLPGATASPVETKASPPVAHQLVLASSSSSSSRSSSATSFNGWPTYDESKPQLGAVNLAQLGAAGRQAAAGSQAQLGAATGGQTERAAAASRTSSVSIYSRPGSSSGVVRQPQGKGVVAVIAVCNLLVTMPVSSNKAALPWLWAASFLDVGVIVAAFATKWEVQYLLSTANPILGVCSGSETACLPVEFAWAAFGITAFHILSTAAWWCQSIEMQPYTTGPPSENPSSVPAAAAVQRSPLASADPQSPVGSLETISEAGDT